MLFGKQSRKRRRSKNIVAYHADNKDPCKEAEGTMFDEWTSYLEETGSIEPDVTVYVENEPYHLHSSVLIFWSDYFTEMIQDSAYNNLEDSDTQTVTCPSVSRTGFDMVLGFMYHRKLFLDEDSIRNVLEVANELRIISVVRCCCNYIVANLRKLDRRIADIIEFLCSPKNQYSSKIIMPQLIKRWDVFQSNEVLRRIPFEFFETMITSNKIPGYKDKDLMSICNRWICVDFSHRYWYMFDLIESVAGKSNFHWKFDLNRFPPKDVEDVGRIFDELLHTCIEDEKIDFVNYFGLVIKKVQKQVYDDMMNDNDIPMKLPLQFYFQEWRHQMDALRNRTSGCDIIVRVNPDHQYMLDYWILCLTSEYFRKFDANSLGVVHLDLTNQEFTSVLNFMYGNVLHITPNNIYDIIRASRYLGMISCKKLIVKFIRKNYTSLDMLELFNVSSEKPDIIYDAMKRRMTRDSTKPRILKRKYPEIITRDYCDLSKFTRPFVIRVPRIDSTAEVSKIEVAQNNKVQYGKPFCIKVPRLRMDFSSC